MIQKFTGRALATNIAILCILSSRAAFAGSTTVNTATSTSPIHVVRGCPAGFGVNDPTGKPNNCSLNTLPNTTLTSGDWEWATCSGLMITVYFDSGLPTNRDANGWTCDPDQPGLLKGSCTCTRSLSAPVALTSGSDQINGFGSSAGADPNVQVPLDENAALAKIRSSVGNAPDLLAHANTLYSQLETQSIAAPGTVKPEDLQNLRDHITNAQTAVDTAVQHKTDKTWLLAGNNDLHGAVATTTTLGQDLDGSSDLGKRLAASLSGNGGTSGTAGSAGSSKGPNTDPFAGSESQQNKDMTASKDTPCKISEGVGGSCDTAYKAVETAGLVSKGLDAMGGLIQSVMGQKANTDASSADGSPAAVAKAAADQFKTAAQSSTISALGNAGLGLFQYMRGNAQAKIKKNLSKDSAGGVAYTGSARDASGAATYAGGLTYSTQAYSVAGTNTGSAQVAAGTGTTGARIVTNYVNPLVTDKNALKTQQGMQSAQTLYEKYRGQMNQEQSKAVNAANGGAIQSMVQAAGQLVAANNYKKAARDAAAAGSELGTSFVAAPIGAPAGPGGDPFAARQGTSITSTGDSGQAAQTAAGSQTASTPPTLGNGFGNGPLPNAPFGGPTPGARDQANAAGTGGGAGGAIGGGGGTAAAAPSDPEQSAQSADNKRVPSDYQAAGGIAGAKGGGGDGSGGGMDLSKLMEAMQPKEADLGPKQGILEYGQMHGRGPANDDNASLLDRNANIFERVHQTYQDKHRRGFIGG